MSYRKAEEIKSRTIRTLSDKRTRKSSVGASKG